MALVLSAASAARKAVHIAALSGAALFPWIGWPGAMLMAAAAFAGNVTVLPRVAPYLLRDADRRGWSGIRFYPLAVLALVIVFRERLDMTAMAWGVMAGGDGVATLAGQRWPRWTLPWNRRKTWSGSLAFIAGGSTAAIAAGAWVAAGMDAPVDPAFTVWAGIAATLAGAVVETVPLRLDDNISVPAAAALTLIVGTLVDTGAAAAHLPAVAAALPIALTANVFAAAAAVWQGSLTRGAAAAGALLGTIILAAGGWSAWAVLGMSFLFTVASSRMGRQRQAELGILEADNRRRGAGSVVANCLTGAVGAMLLACRARPELGAIVLVTGLTAGASDTVASEIGKAFGGTPRSVPGWRAVAPGTPGGVSVAGSTAGVAASLCMALAAAMLPLPGFDRGATVLVAAGALAGSLVESALAGWLEPGGYLTNDALNLVNTTVAATVAVLLLPAVT